MSFFGYFSGSNASSSNANATNNNPNDSPVNSNDAPPSYTEQPVQQQALPAYTSGDPFQQQAPISSSTGYGYGMPQDPYEQQQSSSTSFGYTTQELPSYNNLNTSRNTSRRVNRGGYMTSGPGPSSSNSGAATAEQQEELWNVASAVVCDRLAVENPEELEGVQTQDNESVIVVSGSADKIETVLNAISLPHKVISPADLDSYALSPDSVLYINCHPGGYSANAKTRIKKFVEAGGMLITTDHTLNTLIQDTFPDTIKWAGSSSGDTKVPITHAENNSDEILKSYLDETEWWMCGGAHPITVLDPHKVEVLISSKALGDSTSAVLVKFEHGEGVVYHMVSHFYLQNAATRPANSTAATGTLRVDDYLAMKGGSASTLEAAEMIKTSQEASAGYSVINYDNIQAASTNTEFCYRSCMAQKSRRAKSRN